MFQNFPTTRCSPLSHNYRFLHSETLGCTTETYPVLSFLLICLISGVTRHTLHAVGGGRLPLDGEPPHPPNAESRQTNTTHTVAVVESVYIHKFMYAVIASIAG